VAIFTLTARVLDGSGCVRDVRQAPFAVLEPGQDFSDLEDELLDAAKRLEALATEIAAAQFDESHRHHHWWLP
jgi:hypothetical protein